MSKIRTGFVSNSSSSSFICQVCGEDASGYDIGLSDADMFECENGHTCCNSHRVGGNKELSVKEMKKYLLWTYDGVEEEINRINRASNEEIEVEYNELGDEPLYKVTATKCPICQFKKPDNDSIAKYFLKKNNMTEKDFLANLKDIYGTWEEFQKFIQ